MSTDENNAENTVENNDVAKAEVTKEQLKEQREIAKAEAKAAREKAAEEREVAKAAAKEAREKAKAEREAEKLKLKEEREKLKEEKAAERAAAKEEKEKAKAEKAKAREEAREAKAAAKAEALANKKPGVIASILNIISEATEPVTQEQIAEKLTELFPEREATGLRKTVMAQTGGTIRPNRMEMEKGVTFIIGNVEGTKVKTYLLKK